MPKTEMGTAANSVPGTAIATRKSTDVAALGELYDILYNRKAPVETVESDPDAAYLEIIRDLMDAEDDDELEFVGNAIGWQELEGVPVEIHSFKWRPSEFDQGPPVYLIVFGYRMDDGKRVVLTTGSAGVMAQLWNLAKRDRLPAIRKLVRSTKPTGKNNTYPLRLATPDEVIRDREGQTV